MEIYEFIICNEHDKETILIVIELYIYLYLCLWKSQRIEEIILQRQIIIQEGEMYN